VELLRFIAWLKKHGAWISLVGSHIWLLPIVILLILVVLLLIPFMLFAVPDTFDRPDSAASVLWWHAPRQIDVDGTAYAWPVPTIRNITSPFGERRGNEVHLGIDIADSRGESFTANQPVYAIADGSVTAAGPASGYGQWIVIQHAGGLRSIYGHLDSTMDVHAGETIAKGQRIGHIGRGIVGNSSGPHLHVQMERNGQPLQPLEFVAPPSIFMPPSLSYVPMNVSGMKTWLDQRKSVLADEVILSVIDRAAQSEQVNPYLLIAITGQEQSFVPRSGNYANQVLRNPWNVFGCWCEGKGAQLTTEQSAQIAAQTIVKLSQNRPSGVDPIAWLNDPLNPNGVYAEHRGWYIGVSRFYRAIWDDLEKGGVHHGQE
jgi:murein DD-endopeptidase MepM/ murein hydrolase activator NlpD